MQILYLGILLALLAGGAWAVVRQLLTQREMDERSKVLGELIRTGDAVSEDYYALGVVLTRKKLFTQALKNYVKAIKLWEGDRSDLAEVRFTDRARALAALTRLVRWCCHTLEVAGAGSVAHRADPEHGACHS